MKNPWMSAWLSTANQMASTSRTLMSAEVQRQQNAMIEAWSDATFEFWMRIWFPLMPMKKQRRK
ncbi:hypothetical protein [Paracoccus fistulariae]|uniref:Uncharacterized protein n=1 Tax=Paracoccus fistulariae TaxID=658446 RepID=A0ABY7SN77_9RHOB|nr:hypothetical protein [Paracoccus fistulariae]MDB6180190.1 hypothetical protein [Paracoccus fistulariae]WCR08276.1 hypothetical protein JHX87_05525 [Paracoccus fistulariae]